MAGETKVVPCRKCGRSVTVTKFASAAKVECEQCKGRGKSGGIPDGPTKVCKCVVCGKDVVVTKFATPTNVRCPECKTGAGGRPVKHRVTEEDESDITPLDIDLSASDIFHDDDLLIHPAMIKNERLREVKCPTCDRVMKIIRIMDSSQWGDVVMYQCPGDMTTVLVSEQAKHMMPAMKKSQAFDYRGDTIKGHVTSMGSTRDKNIISYLLQLCEDNGVEIKGMGVFTDEIGRKAILGESDLGCQIID
jgi:DNA-directed RNA polymerase subunit RPC12/RpoP